MRPTGGVLGGALAFQGGTEHQGQGTPHFHGQVHVVCMYQYATMDEVFSRIREGLIQTKDFKAFRDWYHVERPLDTSLHGESEEKVEQDFYDRFRGLEHTPLCQTPPYLQADNANSQDEECLEGLHFKKQYLHDAQFVFSRVQHHVHRKTKDGTYEPLRACAKKKRGKNFIKQMKYASTLSHERHFQRKRS